MRFDLASAPEMVFVLFIVGVVAISGVAVTADHQVRCHYLETHNTEGGLMYKEQVMKCETCNYAISGQKCSCRRCDMCDDFDLYEAAVDENLLTQGEVDADLSIKSVPAIYQVHLKALTGSDEMSAKWWNTPNKAFDGKTPEECHRAGGADEMNVARYVLGMLHR